ncbi:MAG: hypothetical protein ABSG43_16535 [Solirubrobacteraceae bacterium]|jgi:hypothetical protein
MHSFRAAARFARSLEEISDANSLLDERFPARNTRLETTLPDERLRSYLPSGDLDLGSGVAMDTLGAWNGHHDAYLATHVRRGSRAEPFNPSDAITPETFRFRHGLDEYGYADPAIELVRVEDVEYVARVTGERADDLVALAEAVGSARRVGSTSPEVDELDEVLLIWQQAGDLDNRPVFAAFWEDAKELLANPTSGWPDELRIEGQARVGASRAGGASAVHGDPDHGLSLPRDGAPASAAITAPVPRPSYRA